MKAYQTLFVIAFLSFTTVLNAQFPGHCIVLQPDSTGNKNTSVLSSHPNSNDVNSPWVFAEHWTANLAPLEVRGLLNFDLSQIPAGAIIQSATLSLYADTNNTSDGYLGQPTYGTDNATYINRVTSSWIDYVVNWNSQPSFTTSGQALIPQSANVHQDYPNIDITAFAQYWAANPSQNYGMELVMRDTFHYNSMIFCSSHYPDSTKRPKLQICYTLPCVPQAAFTYFNAGNSVAHFTNGSSSTNGFSSNWTFYNASGVIGSSLLSNPQHQFTGATPYSARLIITDSTGGCSDTVLQTLNLVNCITLQPDSTGDKNTSVASSYPAFTGNVNSQWVFAEQWTGNGIPIEVRGLLNFDLSQIPVGATIQNASLSLYADVNNTNDGYLGEPTYGTDNASYLQRVTSSWVDYLANWNNQPTATTTGEVTLPQSTSYTEDYPNLDITSFAQYWVNNPSQNYGMELRMRDNFYYNSMIFCSSHYPDSTKRPKLQLCYTLSCIAHANFSYQDQGGLIAQFINTSASNGGFSSNWTFYNAAGVIGTSNQRSPQQQFAGQAPFSAQLVITDSAGGCTDTITQNITLSNCLILQPDSTGDRNSYVASSFPNQSVATSQWVFAEHWTGNGIPLEVRGLLNFDLSQVPAGANIQSATLSLYADINNIHDGYVGEPTYGSDNATYVQRVTSPWADYLVNWNYQPTSTTTGQVLLPQSSSYTQNYPNIDVTSFVQYWANNPSQNFGMELYMRDQYYYNSMIFCSSHYPDSASRPKLEICYGPNLNACGAVFNYNEIGDTVFFANLSLGNPLSVSWTFGDGSSSTTFSPQHIYTSNGRYVVTLTVNDSTGSCTDTGYVFVNGIINDTLCGYVFNDFNGDGILDNGEQFIPNATVNINGVSYTTDSTGSYHIPVTGGVHYVTVTVPATWRQTAPGDEPYYLIQTANNDYICGLDFGLQNTLANGIMPVGQSKGLELNIFPNPSTGTNVSVKLPSGFTTQNLQLQVTDVLGRTIQVAKTDKAQDRLTISFPDEVDAGIYTIVITQSGERATGKIIISR